MTTLLESLGDMIGKVPGIVWAGGVLFIAFVYNLYSNQNKMLYYPTPPGLPFKRTSDNPKPYDSPESWGMHFEDVQFHTVDNIKLHGWFVRAPVHVDHRTAPTVLFFHANAGNLGFRLPNIDLLVNQLHMNVFIFDYRGYGNSQDVAPDEEGLKLDGYAAMEWLMERDDIDKGKIFVFGRSLGGAVAVNTLSVPRYGSRVAGVILENTFTSIADMVDNLFPLLSYLKGIILKIRWPSVDLIGGLEHPMLFVSGAKDQLVPPPMLRRLHDAAGRSADRELYVVADGEHNDTYQKGGAEYALRLRAFVDRVLRRKLGDAGARTRLLHTLSREEGDRLVRAGAGAEARAGAAGGELTEERVLKAAASAEKVVATHAMPAAAAVGADGADGEALPAASAAAVAGAPAVLLSPASLEAAASLLGEDDSAASPADAATLQDDVGVPGSLAARRRATSVESVEGSGLPPIGAMPSLAAVLR
jgi:fermentation-respiration switch protein FrsA (DUF1100 family)